MRIYKSAVDMVTETERELFEMGINNHPDTMQDKRVGDLDDYDTKELVGYCYQLTRWVDKNEVFSLWDNDLKEVGLNYALREFFERLGSPSNPGSSWELRRSLWEPFLERNGRFSYTYSERIFPQLEGVVDNLREEKGSRQCIVTVYDHHQDLTNIGGKSRVPCSLYYQFLKRNINNSDHLWMMYSMRSCDYYNHFPVDVHIALQLLEYVAALVGAVPSRFVHFIGSLHAYKKDWKYRRIF